MTPQELEHQNWKKQLRQEALEKEVARLKKLNIYSNKKIKKLKNTSLYLLLFFIILLCSFFLTDVISFKSKAEPQTNTNEQLLSEESEKWSDSIQVLIQQIDLLKENRLNYRNENGYKFRVQIGAFKELNLNDFTENLVTISQEKYDSINQYTLGSFADYTKAHKFLERVKKMGFKDSFIIATQNGKRIPVKDAIENQTTD